MLKNEAFSIEVGYSSYIVTSLWKEIFHLVFLYLLLYVWHVLVTVLRRMKSSRWRNEIFVERKTFYYTIIHHIVSFFIAWAFSLDLFFSFRPPFFLLLTVDILISLPLRFCCVIYNDLISLFFPKTKTLFLLYLRR